MILHHVLGGGSNLDALRLLEVWGERTNGLVSAWSWHTPAELRREKALLRRTGRHRLFDSGFLSAAKRGEWAWADRTDDLVRWGLDLGADRIVALDILSEPEILAGVGLSVAETRRLTLRNTERFLRDGRLPPEKNRSLEEREANSRRPSSRRPPFLSPGWPTPGRGRFRASPRRLCLTSPHAPSI